MEAVSFFHQCELPFPSCQAGFLHPLLGSDPCTEEGKTAWVWEGNEDPFRSMASACSTASIQRSKVKKSLKHSEKSRSS